MMRKSWWAVMVLGLAMIVAPFALGVPSKSSAGQRMMDDFRPLMQQSSVDQTASYYNDVFVPLGEVVVPAMGQENVDTFTAYVQGFAAMGVDANNMVPALAEAMNMTTEQVQGFLATQFPAMSQILQNLPAMQQDFDNLVTLMRNNVATFERVPAGLAHYQPLVQTMQGNVEDYRKADSLPPMNLFTWFFVVPGILFVALSLFGLFGGRRGTPIAHDEHLDETPDDRAAEREFVSSVH